MNTKTYLILVVVLMVLSGCQPVENIFRIVSHTSDNIKQTGVEENPLFHDSTDTKYEQNTNSTS